ncbi:hypothetical protein CRUP_007991 [Coryphaenoides rupestris]|nr:hypothetical protein CRUP_007991 [Coryphaenoides rupestris]
MASCNFFTDSITVGKLSWKLPSPSFSQAAWSSPTHLKIPSSCSCTTLCSSSSASSACLAHSSAIWIYIIFSAKEGERIEGEKEREDVGREMN